MSSGAAGGQAGKCYGGDLGSEGDGGRSKVEQSRAEQSSSRAHGGWSSMSPVTCHSRLDRLLTLWASCSPACAAEVVEHSSHFELARVEHVSLKSHEKAECARRRGGL